MNSLYTELIDITAPYFYLQNTLEALHWDQEVVMMEKGAPIRAKQIGAVSQAQHKIITNSRVAELLEALDTDTLTREQKAVHRELQRLHVHATKVPEKILVELSELRSETISVWKKAREKDDFNIVKPQLKRLVELNQEYAKSIDDSVSPYQVLLDQYEPYQDLEEVRKLLNSLKEQLIPIVETVHSQEQPDTSCVNLEFNQADILVLIKSIADTFGFDFDNGRIDESVHPFMCRPADCRITVRYGNGYAEALSAGAHELGHALYEQDLLVEKYGTPLGDSRSMTIHESQSRFYENHIYRSREFLKTLYPRIQEAVPGLQTVAFESFYAAIHKSEPSLIRVSADELTYPLHVILRFELEEQLINGEIEVDDLPRLWNEKMKTYLGIDVPSDIQGVLQDIHWYQGSFGYFSTYVLGSMLSAQLEETIRSEIPDYTEKLQKHDLREIREWLSEHIHEKGQLYTPQELIKQVTDSPLKISFYVNYLENKFYRLYGINR